MEPIFLVGLPASGKTTLGRALARTLGADFIDLDHYIEGRFSRSVASIFALWGEERFRRIEANMLREVGEMQDVVVACGGGTPCFHSGMEYMLSRGKVLYLQASRARLVERLARARARRPGVKDIPDDALGQYADRLLSERGPVYARAHAVVESTELESRQSIAQTVHRALAALTALNPLTPLNPNTPSIWPPKN